MLRPRISPCLLIKNNGLVKSIKFKNHRYIGDPINTVRIFNEKEVDEIVILDIDASFDKREPNFALIRRLASECNMPMCYGGGISNSDQAISIFRMGVEKIAISSSAFEKDGERLIRELVDKVGSQSIVIVMDIKKGFLGDYSIRTLNGTKKVEGNIEDWVYHFQKLGVGEFIFNNIDRDGTFVGYDIAFANRIKSILDIPVTFLGGCSSLENIRELIRNVGVVGTSAGSLFIYKGKLRAVLINYLTDDQKKYVCS